MALKRSMAGGRRATAIRAHFLLAQPDQLLEELVFPALPSFLPSFPSPFLVQRRWRSDVWKQAKLEIHSFHSAIRLHSSPAMQPLSPPLKRARRIREDAVRLIE